MSRHTCHRYADTEARHPALQRARDWIRARVLLGLARMALTRVRVEVRSGARICTSLEQGYAILPCLLRRLASMSWQVADRTWSQCRTTRRERGSAAASVAPRD